MSTSIHLFLRQNFTIYPRPVLSSHYVDLTGLELVAKLGAQQLPGYTKIET